MAASVKAVSADTSGSYSELVARANDLYDQGDAAFQNQPPMCVSTASA